MRNLTSLSRRSFAKLVGVGAATAVARPSFSWAGTTVSRTISNAASTAVRLNSNENPYGPSPMAIKAMTDAFSLVWRYPDEHADALLETLTKLHGVTREQIVLGDGSGEILKVCAEAFTGPMTNDTTPIELSKPTRGPALQFIPGRGKLIVADPTYEAIVNHARVNRAEVVKVPLNRKYAHDLPKMLAAAAEGLIYICNPNNPTASITPKNELREFINKASPKTMILVDEAYFHYADSADYESVLPLVKDHPNLIVARTFSKVYAMAGLRCGYCITQPETIRRMRPHLTWDSVNIMALAAANASLSDRDQVSHGCRLNTETKQFVLDEIKKLGFDHIPSQANFLMIDVKQPVRPLIDAMSKLNVQVGRAFPSLPNHMRVTIGKQNEMEAFMSAFKKVALTTPATTSA
jgi:histidinol-phosphate aminotransferase